jgi:glycosyltransferase involved in cell wall biosynthesis
LVQAFAKHDIEILVATMHRDSLDFLKPLFPFAHFSGFNILVINQTTPRQLLTSTYPNIRVINSFEKGLSKSRNLALKNATGKLCIITDDDLNFLPDFESKVLTAYNRYSDVVLAAFRTEDAQGQLYKKYPPKRKLATNDLERLNIMSVEMVVNLPVVQALGISFNERFGLGADFTMGEEAVFINGLHKKGGKVLLEPQTLTRHAAPDTHACMGVKQKYYVQGALFTALFSKNYLLWVFLKLVFEIKQRATGIGQVPAAIKAARKGHNDYTAHEDNT